MNNEYIKAQITNVQTILGTFEQSCKMAAIKNDGVIDKAEEKTLKKIHAATERYKHELQKIKEG